MRKVSFKYLPILFLTLLLLLPACQRELPEPEGDPVSEGGTTVHFRAFVSGSEGTKATLDALDRSYLFERDDLLYVVDEETDGTKLYGFLYLISGAGTSEAVFEGDLVYFDRDNESASYKEPLTPSDDMAVSATLVSQAQREANVYTFVSGNPGKIASGPNFGDHFATDFKEAVQKYSTFTADATYGHPSFQLNQGTAFLLFSLSFDDDIDSSSPLAVSMTNNNGVDNLLSSHAIAADDNHQASFVAVFENGTTLSSAKLTISGSFSKTKSLSSATLQGNHYYNVVRSFVDLQYFTIQATNGADTDISFPEKYQAAAYGLQYSRDGSTWEAVGSTSIHLDAGESIKLRGKGSKYKYGDGNTPLFTSTAACYIYGDVMSLFCNSTYTAIPTAFTGSNSSALEGAFKGMTNLDIHPARPLLLSAQTLSNYCYKQMFFGSSITRAPEFTDDDGNFANNIPTQACMEMFKDCTLLTAASDIQASGTIGTQGFQAMFSGCTTLVTPPMHLRVTPANSTSSNFREMFKNCTSLRFAPELTAAEVRSNGCREMFSGCTSLEAAPNLPAETVREYGYHQMFLNCSQLTTGPSSLPAETMEQYGYFQMFKGCSLLEDAPTISATTLSDYCFKEMFSGCSMLRTAQETFNFSSIPTQACYQMFFNCLALNGAPNMPYVSSVDSNGCYQMFYGCGEMRTAPAALTATTVGESGYKEMFVNCARLLQAPVLSATTIGNSGYQGMFKNCTRLLTASALPATSLGTAAYAEMFYGCTALETPPPSLPASTLPFKVYYRMFYGCSHLLSIPEFPHDPVVDYVITPGTSAEKGSESGICFQMFYHCIALETLDGRQLFNSKSPLGLGCFQDMFSTCDNLATVPENFLPATTLAKSCYRGMFQATAITRAPDLKAPALEDFCYRYMFYGCKSLSYIKCYSTTSGNDNYTQNWLKDAKNVSGAGAEFHYRSGVDWLIDNNHGIPENWTPVSDTVE